ncbi:MAG: hypothetical protein AAB116_13010 [Candidatus Poribacteria bacterium]
MNQFFVNGVKYAVPLTCEQTLGDLLCHIRKTFNSSESRVSKIVIDGHEISEETEQKLLNTPLSELTLLEADTSNPLEVARDTLNALSEFLVHLENKSRNAGKSSNTGEFVELLEGLHTFSEAVTGVKNMFKTAIPPNHLPDSIKTLESSLLEILRDLLHYKRSGLTREISICLGRQLPTHLSMWRTSAIPSLIKASVLSTICVIS